MGNPNWSSLTGTSDTDLHVNTTSTFLDWRSAMAQPLEHLTDVVREQATCSICRESRPSLVYASYRGDGDGVAWCTACAAIADELPWGGAREKIEDMADVRIRDGSIVGADPRRIALVIDELVALNDRPRRFVDIHNEFRR